MRVESALHGRVRDNCKATPSPGLDRPSPLMLWTRQSFGRSRRLSCHDRRPAEVELRVSSTDSSRFPHALYLLDPREVCFWSRLFQLWQSHWPKGRPELQQSTRINISVLWGGPVRQLRVCDRNQLVMTFLETVFQFMSQYISFFSVQMKSALLVTETYYPWLTSQTGMVLVVQRCPPHLQRLNTLNRPLIGLIGFGFVLWWKRTAHHQLR